MVAASDGKVLGVERLHDERFGDGEFLRIAVFLSVLDVHVNRAPVAGKVVDYFVVDGGFAAAMKPDAEHNVAAYTVLETARGTVVVAQRTGLIARRIVQRAPVGSLLAKGERFGLIRFGSRTDVYLPADAADAAGRPGRQGDRRRDASSPAGLLTAPRQTPKRARPVSRRARDSVVPRCRISRSGGAAALAQPEQRAADQVATTTSANVSRTSTSAPITGSQPAATAAA